MLSLDETLTWAAMEAICSQLIMILTTLNVMDDALYSDVALLKLLDMSTYNNARKTRMAKRTSTMLLALNPESHLEQTP